MSSLARYKKSGGFFQLLSLIETFGPQKREKFLEMIEAESPVWAKALREKMLSLERVFSWPDQIAVEVFRRLPVKGQAYALPGLKDEYKAKIMPLISSSEQRRINDAIIESAPKPEETQAILVKLVETARRMIVDRELHPEKFDQALIIPESFESKLDEQGLSALVNATVDSVTAPPTDTSESQSGVHKLNFDKASGSADVAHLQKTVSVLAKENKTLREEVTVLRSKLEQIRKIA